MFRTFVDFPFLYAACSIGISLSILSFVLLHKHIASSFLSVDSKVIGRRFEISPLVLPGFWSRAINHWIICLGHLPVCAVSLKMFEFL